MSAVLCGWDGAFGDFGADDGSDFGAEEFDGLEDLVVGHGGDAELEEEAVVFEYGVLMENFFDDLVWGADEVCPT